MSKYTELLDNIVGRCNEDGEFEKKCAKLEEHIEDIIVEHIQNNEVFAAMYTTGFQHNNEFYLDLDEMSKDIVRKYKILVYGETLKGIVVEALNGLEGIEVLDYKKEIVSSKLTYMLFKDALNSNKICVILDLDTILNRSK